MGGSLVAPAHYLKQSRRDLSKLLSIDPGNVETGWVLMDEETYTPEQFGKTENEELLRIIGSKEFQFDYVVIEKIVSYGMAVGASVLETCMWIGRFYEFTRTRVSDDPVLQPRQEIRLHHCMNPKATDSNVKQALIDRFAKNTRNHGKGTKAEPGYFYGFHKDVWQAFALGVHYLDKKKKNHGNIVRA